MAKIERTKNTVIGALWGELERIANTLLPFLVRTILIQKLGSEYLGLNSLFSSILQVLNLSELGFGEAAVYVMYKPIAEDEHSTVGAILQYLRKIYRYIGIAVIVAGLSVLPFLNDLISGDIPNDIDVYLLYLIYLINTSLSYLLFAYKSSLLSALQLKSIISKVGFWSNSILYFLQIVVLLVFPNYYVYVILLPVSTLCQNLIKSYIVDTKYNVWLCPDKLDVTIKEEMKSKLFPLFSTKLAVVLLNSVDTIVVSAFLGLNTVAIYNNYYYIMTSVSGFLIVIYSAMQAGIGNSLVTEKKEIVINHFYVFSFINNWIVVICTTCLVCLYQPFMMLWVGEELMFPFGMVILFCIYFFSIVSLRIVVIYKDAAGIWREDMFRCYLSCFLNLLINIASVRYIGVYGVIGSSVFVSVFIDPWIANTLFKVQFKDSPRLFYKNYIFTVFSGCISATISLLLSTKVVDGIFGILIKLIICLIVSNAILLLFYRKDKTFVSAKKWIATKFLRRRGDYPC